MIQSTRKLLALAAGAALVVLAIWYVVLWRPESAKLKSAHAAYASTMQQVASTRSQVADLEALVPHIPADRAALAALQAAVPGTPDLKDLLQQVHADAIAAGAQLTAVSPSAPNGTSGAHSSSGSELQSVSVGLTASGNYPQLRQFIVSLTTLQRTMVIDSITINGSVTGALTADLTTRIFYAPSAS